MKIGIVSCNKWNGLIKEDVMLCNKLIENGHNAKIISWDDKDIDVRSFDCLVLRSVWGYQNDYVRFKEWLLYLKENNVLIFNDVSLMLDNVRKDRQFKILDEHKIAHVPTVFIKDYAELERQLNGNMNGFVIKPIISGSGDNTFYITEGNKLGILEIFSKIMNFSDNGAMIQPYIPEVGNGEIACVFINGENTHNMLRFPGVFADKQKPIYLESVPKDAMDLAYRVARVPQFRDYLYMRVDIVYNNGRPLVMEVELTEPDLLIKYIPDMGKRDEIVSTFARKLEKRL